MSPATAPIAMARFAFRGLGLGLRSLLAYIAPSPAPKVANPYAPAAVHVQDRSVGRGGPSASRDRGTWVDAAGSSTTGASCKLSVSAAAATSMTPRLLEGCGERLTPARVRAMFL